MIVCVCVCVLPLKNKKHLWYSILLYENFCSCRLVSLKLFSVLFAFALHTSNNLQRLASIDDGLRLRCAPPAMQPEEHQQQQHYQADSPKTRNAHGYANFATKTEQVIVCSVWFPQWPGTTNWVNYYQNYLVGATKECTNWHQNKLEYIRDKYGIPLIEIEMEIVMEMQIEVSERLEGHH